MITLLGVDLGTSSFKVSAYREDGTHLGTLARKTPWRKDTEGAKLGIKAFKSAITQLIGDCVIQHARGRVAGVGVTGMAESIFVTTQDGRSIPARAWNLAASRSEQHPDQALFARTGLLDPARTPSVRLHHLINAGERVVSWAGLPESAVNLLGGRLVAERSLAARTGLIDVHEGTWSDQMLAWSGVDRSTTPALETAGMNAGEVTAVDACRGATLTVAGHDHLVAALGAGAWSSNQVFDSLGTGEAIVAHVGSRLDSEQYERFKEEQFNVGFGLQDGDLIVLAGLGTGGRFQLLLKTLTASGFSVPDIMASDAADAPETLQARKDLPRVAHELVQDLFGPNWQRLHDAPQFSEAIADVITDTALARAIWWEGMDLATQIAKARIDALRAMGISVDEVVAAGGWLANRAIRRARRAILGPFSIPQTPQSGTRGAAMLAGLAAGVFASRDDFPSVSYERGEDE